MQNVADRHVTASSAADAPTTGVTTLDHAVPLHSYATALVGAWVVLPTATHHVVDAHDTDRSAMESADGRGVGAQAPSTSRSAKPFESETPDCVDPTAMHVPSCEHDTLTSHACAVSGRVATRQEPFERVQAWVATSSWPLAFLSFPTPTHSPGRHETSVRSPCSTTGAPAARPASAPPWAGSSTAAAATRPTATRRPPAERSPTTGTWRGYDPDPLGIRAAARRGSPPRQSTMAG